MSIYYKKHTLKICNGVCIQEDGFVTGCSILSDDMLESILDFQILPNYMKERLHQNLPEVN